MLHPMPLYEFVYSDINELIKRVIDESLVAYLGGGASIAAGLPRWGELIDEIIKLLRKLPEEADNLRSITTLYNEGSLPHCSELIEILSRQEVRDYIVKRYAVSNVRATSIHKEVSRIPFSFVFSTNYDCLMESVFPKKVPKITWKSGNELFTNLKDNRFSIVKMHGSVSDKKSIILTKSQYYKSDSSKVLQEALEYLFSYKTVLFIGSSLKDPNLQRILKHTRLTHGDHHFGPHYAIMFDDEVDRVYCDYLWEDYKIAVILCKTDSPEPSREWRTNAVSSVLKDISGKTSIYAYENYQTPNLTSSHFYLKDAAKETLEEILERTGSNLGYIAYTYDTAMQQLILEAVIEKVEQEYVHVDESSPRYKGLEKLLGPSAPLAKLYLQSHNRHEPYYISDVTAPQFDRVDRKELHYVSLDDEARSVLICPIRSDGKAIGILVIESHNIDTYTVDHERAIKAAADIAGAAHAEYEHREDASKGIKPYLYWGEDFFELMNKNRDLAKLEMSYILYEVNYIEGKLKAHYDGMLYPPAPDIELFEYPFLSNSLAAHTLRKRESIYIEDVNEELANPNCRLAEKGVIRFDIKGGVYALPIRVEGRISTILVAWSRKGDRQLKKYRSRIYRLSHFIVNDPARNKTQDMDDRCSHRFLDRLNKKLEVFDGGKSWTLKDLFNAGFRANTIDAILTTLTERACGLKRVRLWLFDYSQEYFECIYSYSSESAINGDEPEIGKYKPLTLSANNIYSQHTINRAPSDPFARLQHVSMFGEQDPVSKYLDKDLEGRWFVAPIVDRDAGKRELLGYIAADNHCRINNIPVDMRPSEKQEAFQRYALNYVSDLLVDLLRAIRVKQHKER